MQDDVEKVPFVFYCCNFLFFQNVIDNNAFKRKPIAVIEKRVRFVKIRNLKTFFFFMF